MEAKSNGVSGSAEKLNERKPTEEKVTEGVSNGAMEDVDTQCGYTATCKPAWLQRGANAKAYLVVISLCSIIQGFAVNGINNVNISSYERRYLLTSKDSSLVASFYDVAAGLTVLFVGYFGGTGHQPRYLGCGVASIALGTFVMSLAHFGAPPYEPQGLSTVCDVAATNGTACLSSSTNNAFLKNYLYVLLLGQALNGFGGTCLYTLGVTYLDQSVSSESSPLYIGVMAGSSVLGPACGYIIGGYLLKIYVDFPSPPPDGLTDSSPSWVGAWWLGFVISAIFATILAFFMFLFPRELPGTQAIRAAKISEAHNNGTEDKVNSSGFGLSMRDIPMAIWYLLKNPTYLCITAVVGLELITAAGMSTFLPKYIANQFAVTASWASMLTGLMAVPGAAFGQLLGGYICKRFQLKMKGILKLTTISSIIVILVTPVLWSRCDDPNFAGLSAAYPGSSKPDTPNLDSSCNTGCGCTTEVYDPVCANGVQYFSSCHAGCSNAAMIVDGIKVYHNCSCPMGVGPAHPQSNHTLVTSGICQINCDLLYYAFVPMAFLLFFFTFLMGSPLTVATIRVVPEKQRAFAVALQWVFLRFLGSIPGPIIFGAMIDASCVLWKEDCGVEGSCWVYNNFNMSTRLFVLVLIVKILSVGFNVVACIVYKAPPDKAAKPDGLMMETMVDQNENSSNSMAQILRSSNGT